MGTISGQPFSSSIWLKSGLWLGHSCVVLVVWLGSLSCWKVNLQPSLRSWLLIFFIKDISVLCSVQSPSVCRWKIPCFTVGMALSRWWAVLGFLQTSHLELWPNSSILASSGQRIVYLTVSLLGVFVQTPSRLSCVFHWAEASVWPLCHKAQIGGV